MLLHFRMSPKDARAQKRPRGAGLFALLQPYWGLVTILVVLTISANGLVLVVPKLISQAIDAYTQRTLVLSTVVLQFFLIVLFVFALTYLQSITQTYASERVARDLRMQMAAKIATLSYSAIERLTPAKLLTNLTSDVDGVKLFVSQAVATIIASLFLIVGTSVMLLTINWRLGLSVLGVVPVVGGTFFFALRRVRVLFKRGQEAIDWLNRLIDESILGATLIRILNSQRFEAEKFAGANTESREIGLAILRIVSAIVPAIILAADLATITILLLGGHFVILGSMTLGEFAAFNSYLETLIFPIILLGYMSNVIAQAAASYGRLGTVLMAPEPKKDGTLRRVLRGDLAIENVWLAFDDKEVLKNVSLSIKGGSKTAIIGPTAAGKTQLLYVLTGLLQPTAGTVTYDGEPLEAYDKDSLHRQVGFAFQDAIPFNMSLRENIAFSADVTDADLEKAIAAAELRDFIGTLPQGLDTVVSERGTTLSGGQKQRVMLARALALNPKVLLLDDFTSGVDTATERAILRNIHEQYPGITLISVTQKIASVENYDQIILLMEGEMLAIGTHVKLMETSPEYVEIYDSQRSIDLREVPA
jgi:ATP-binding cassette, subfamily B, bacterial